MRANDGRFRYNNTNKDKNKNAFIPPKNKIYLNKIETTWNH